MVSVELVSAGDTDLLVVRVAEQRCGLPTERVEQVLRACAVSPLPGAPAWVAGAINLRGRVAAVVDLRARLGLDPRPLSPTDHFVIVTVRGRPLVLRVDQALDLVTVCAAQIEQAEESFEGRPLAGAVAMPDGLLFVYDLERFVSEAEQSKLEELLE